MIYIIIIVFLHFYVFLKYNILSQYKNTLSGYCDSNTEKFHPKWNVVTNLTLTRIIYNFIVVVSNNYLHYIILY